MNLIDAHLPAILGGRSVFDGKLPIVRPWVPPFDSYLEDARRLFESGELTNGRWVQEFETRVAERLGVPECVAVSSCTSGLALLFRCLDLKGEVIMPSFTFFATGHAVVWSGLTPVFADCDRESFNIDPQRVEQLISPSTSAILAVHLYGNPADTQALERLALRYSLKVIFDAAHAFGSQREGRWVGSFGDAEVFSLSPTKLLVAGEGGLVSTRDPQLATRLRAARNYGDAGTYDPIVLGLNARMPEINALLALRGLDSVDTQAQGRNAVAERLTTGLRSLPGLGFQKVRRQDLSTYKDFGVLVDGEQFGLTRDELGVALLADNVEVKKYFYPPLHAQKLYKKFYGEKAQPLTATEQISQAVLNLPIYASLTDETVDRITDAIHRIHAHRSQIGELLR